MGNERNPQTDQRVGLYTPVRTTTATMLQPVTNPISPQPAPAMTLYQVPVPGAVQVQLPDGRTAWGHPVEHHLDPLSPATASSEAMPGWAMALSLVAGSLTLMALGSVVALRIAAPPSEDSWTCSTPSGALPSPSP
ncbi:hypothetical protein ACWGN9_13020 [Streptomyces sp. NPDC055775]